MTSSNGNIFRVTGHLCHRWIPRKGQWRGALMFSLICAWINGWVNNGMAGDSRCHRAHCDVIVMTIDWNCVFSKVLQFWRKKAAGKTGKRYLSTEQELPEQESKMSNSDLPDTKCVRPCAYGVRVLSNVRILKESNLASFLIQEIKKKNLWKRSTNFCPEMYESVS